MMTDDRPEHQTQHAQTERLDALEMRVAFLDELLDSLNGVVAQQDQHISALQAQCRMLYQQLQSDQKHDIGIEPFNAMSDIPPHY
jgi:SlyX protein